jgi:hypothetical protein
MAKFHGVVGYGESVETDPDSGVYEDLITEQLYYGDVIRNQRGFNDSGEVLGDIRVNNSISLVADEFAIEHMHQIKYVDWSGELWTVTNVEVKHPRLILNLGSVYNGPTP